MSSASISSPPCCRLAWRCPSASRGSCVRPPRAAPSRSSRRSSATCVAASSMCRTPRMVNPSSDPQMVLMFSTTPFLSRSSRSRRSWRRSSRFSGPGTQTPLSVGSTAHPESGTRWSATTTHSRRNSCRVLTTRPNPRPSCASRLKSSRTFVLSSTASRTVGRIASFPSSRASSRSSMLIRLNSEQRCAASRSSTRCSPWPWPPAAWRAPPAARSSWRRPPRTPLGRSSCAAAGIRWLPRGWATPLCPMTPS
mmetsp:Transcript_96716/g.282738  ORF Transcript_96716/g.282738 Transcript_96716/m.282738 type:complete len:252 (+) Transcript_96716:1922-2677(+)